MERRAFSNNTELQALRLDSNEINDIVGLFADLKNLRYLNISDNKIQKFDYFLLPPSLNWLDVHKNEIEDIGNYFDKVRDRPIAFDFFFLLSSLFFMD